MTIRSLRAFKQKSDYIKIFKCAPVPLQVLLPLPLKDCCSDKVTTVFCFAENKWQKDLKAREENSPADCF
jgi:hypothetical protein